MQEYVSILHYTHLKRLSKGAQPLLPHKRSPIDGRIDMWEFKLNVDKLEASGKRHSNARATTELHWKPTNQWEITLFSQDENCHVSFYCR